MDLERRTLVSTNPVVFKSNSEIVIQPLLIFIYFQHIISRTISVYLRLVSSHASQFSLALFFLLHTKAPVMSSVASRTSCIARMGNMTRRRETTCTAAPEEQSRSAWRYKPCVRVRHSCCRHFLNNPSSTRKTTQSSLGYLCPAGRRFSTLPCLIRCHVPQLKN
jgi:hypothetical protein